MEKGTDFNKTDREQLLEICDRIHKRRILPMLWDEGLVFAAEYLHTIMEIIPRLLNTLDARDTTVAEITRQRDDALTRLNNFIDTSGSLMNLKSALERDRSAGMSARRSGVPESDAPNDDQRVGWQCGWTEMDHLLRMEAAELSGARLKFAAYRTLEACAAVPVKVFESWLLNAGWRTPVTLPKGGAVYTWPNGTATIPVSEAVYIWDVEIAAQCAATNVIVVLNDLLARAQWKP